MNRIMFIVFATLLLPLGRIWASEVQLEVEQDRGSYYAEDQSALFLRVLLSVSDEVVLEERTPLNLCLVVDRSGSMVGERMDATRSAILEAVGNMAMGDVISIISYGSDVETLVEATSVGDLRGLNTRVQEIEAEGGAAMYDALNQAAAQVRRNKTSEGINRIILLADGPTTRGPREFEDFTKLAEVFAAEGITLSTIGIGEDFNEDLLSRLADIGKGNFYFVQELEELEKAYLSDVRQVGAFSVKDLFVQLDMERDFVPWDLYGREGELKGRDVTIEFGDLYQGQQLEGIVHVQVRGLSGKSSSFRIGWIRLYRGSSEDLESAELLVEQELKISTTRSLGVSNRSLNLEVLRSVLTYQVAESMEAALEQADDGKLDYAIRELKDTARDLRRLNFEYEDLVIEQMHLELTAFTERLEQRGLNRIDRKLLRFKIYNTEVPVVAEEEGESAED